MRSKRSLPEECMVSENCSSLSSRCSFLFSVRSWERTIILFSGVRNSCDIFARNSDLYLLACAISLTLFSISLRAIISSLFLRLMASLCISSALERSPNSSFVCFSFPFCACNTSSEALSAVVCSCSSSLACLNSSC